MLNSGVSPSVARESSLSQFADDPPRKYYLSKTACLVFVVTSGAEARNCRLSSGCSILSPGGTGPIGFDGYNET